MYLLEVSWEVCNKVGGIHTVIATKAASLVEAHGDRYITFGPWLTTGSGMSETFDAEPGHDALIEACRKVGVPIRVGRWRLPSRPRVILVGFSDLFAQKDIVLAKLWEHYRVDSLFGGWDYVEPVLFSHAVGLVIEQLWLLELAGSGHSVVSQFHEWMTGAGLLHLKRKVPAIATVFTTHATILGRSLAASGSIVQVGPNAKTPEQAADELGIRAKHSLESVCAREGDIFTTVSRVTAIEATKFFKREPDLTPNGVDLRYARALAQSQAPQAARTRLTEVAEAMAGRRLVNPFFVAISGRYEFHNKGIDLFIDALAEMSVDTARPVVAYFLIPAANTGVRAELRNRLANPSDPTGDQSGLGISTHRLADNAHDAIVGRCRTLGLTNRDPARPLTIFVPDYIHAHDRLFDCDYEALVQGFDATCFPSAYEPWGYTPLESLAMGVPTITSDMAGFGQWALEHGLVATHLLEVLARERASRTEACHRLAHLLESQRTQPWQAPGVTEACKQIADVFSWSRLLTHYEKAYAAATQLANQRSHLRQVPRPVPATRARETAASSHRRPNLRTIEVISRLPRELEPLRELANNYWWTWNVCAQELFAAVDPQAWEESRHDPRHLLEHTEQPRLERLAKDPAFGQQLARVYDKFRSACLSSRNEDLDLPPGISDESPIVYICAEYGIHPQLKIYSGGLGILAGDHVKAASDMRLPLVAIGLFYRRGYIDQHVSIDGDQIALPVSNDPSELPLEPVLADNRQPLTIELALPDRTLIVRVFLARVGRTKLYLLDTDQSENSAKDRGITHQLYVSDRQTRLLQEIVLGIGASRLLDALRITPSCIHLNEGHSAFFLLQRAAKLVREADLSFEEAHTVLRNMTVFTTHTPVEAGMERFSEDAMRQHFGHLPRELGITWERFMALGLAQGHEGAFDLTHLAARFAWFTNGVSRLHGTVSRKLLRDCWPGQMLHDVPVRSVTNGVHLATWTHPSMAALLGREGGLVRPEDFRSKVGALESASIWRFRCHARERLLNYLRDLVRRQAIARRCSPSKISAMLDGLRDDALIVGFARRFAPYKRAHLLLRDIARLTQIVSDSERPVRILFAGLAHPSDGEGLDLLRALVRMTHEGPLVGKIFFLEGYNMEMATHLVQGVDLWLNTPIRGLEASGTSGMKVAANGGLHLSVDDGWWIEGFVGDNGWSINAQGPGIETEFQTELDAAAIYHALQDEAVEEFFERNSEDVPLRWTERIRRSLKSIPTLFNTERMLTEYLVQAYTPTARRVAQLRANSYRSARDLSARSQHIRTAFAGLELLTVETTVEEATVVGSSLQVQADLVLGTLRPEDIEVQAVLGRPAGEGELENAEVFDLSVQPPSPKVPQRAVRYFARLPLDRAGTLHLAVRVRPRLSLELDEGLGDLVLWD